MKYTIFLVLFSTLSWTEAITSLNLFKENDYNTCLQGAPDRTINITNDGNCYELVEAHQELESNAWYYRAYINTMTGAHSGLTYDFETLVIIERCDCEYINGREGTRHYNRSCLVGKIYHQCESFKNNRKTKLFWNALYNDPTLKFWGVNVDYMKNYILY